MHTWFQSIFRSSCLKVPLPLSSMVLSSKLAVAMATTDKGLNIAGLFQGLVQMHEIHVMENLPKIILNLPSRSNSRKTRAEVQEDLSEVMNLGSWFSSLAVHVMV